PSPSPYTLFPYTTLFRSAHEVYPTPLPGRPWQHLRDGLSQALVGIGNHQAHAPQPSPHQASEEGHPELIRFSRPEVEPQDLPVRSEEHTSELQSRENIVC